MKLPTYDIQLRKIVSGGHRNIHSYYMIFKNGKNPIKYISKAMRLDQDNSDTVTAEVQIKPNLLEVWNYDKMTLVQRFPWDFKTQPLFTCAIYQDNMQLTIKRQNPWQTQVKQNSKLLTNQQQQKHLQKNPKMFQKNIYSKDNYSTKGIQSTTDRIVKKCSSKKPIKQQQNEQFSTKLKGEQLGQQKLKGEQYKDTKVQQPNEVNNKISQMNDGSYKLRRNDSQQKSKDDVVYEVARL